MGEKVVCSERVVDPPAGTVMAQLNPAPLSSSVVHWQVSGNCAPLGVMPLYTVLYPSSRWWDPPLSGEKPTTRPAGELFGLAEQKMPCVDVLKKP